MRCDYGITKHASYIWNIFLQPQSPQPTMQLTCDKVRAEAAVAPPPPNGSNRSADFLLEENELLNGSTLPNGSACC